MYNLEAYVALVGEKWSGERKIENRRHNCVLVCTLFESHPCI